MTNDERRRIGRGIFSGPNGEWRALNLGPDFPAVPRWRIYYPDRFIDGVTEEDWDQAPEGGVQVLLLFNGIGCTVCGGYDEYAHPHFEGRKYGLMIDWDEHINIAAAADNYVRSWLQPTI